VIIGSAKKKQKNALAGESLLALSPINFTEAEVLVKELARKSPGF